MKTIRHLYISSAMCFYLTIPWLIGNGVDKTSSVAWLVSGDNLQVLVLLHL